MNDLDEVLDMLNPSLRRQVLNAMHKADEPESSNHKPSFLRLVGALGLVGVCTVFTCVGILVAVVLTLGIVTAPLGWVVFVASAAPTAKAWKRLFRLVRARR